MISVTQEQRDALIKHIESVIAQFDSDSYKFPLPELVYKLARAALEVERKLAESYPDDIELQFRIESFDDEEYGDLQSAQWLKELRRRRETPVPLIKPVVLGESQTFPDFPGEEWLWKPGVIKAILESGGTVAGEGNAITE